MCFEHQGIIFNGEKKPKFFINAYGKAGGGLSPPPPLRSAWPWNIRVFFTASLSSTMTQRLFPYLSKSSLQVEGKLRKCISHIFDRHTNYLSICNSGLQPLHCCHSCLKGCNRSPGDTSRSRCKSYHPWQSHLEPNPNATQNRRLHRSNLTDDRELEHRYLTNYHHRRVQKIHWNWLQRRCHMQG